MMELDYSLSKLIQIIREFHRIPKSKNISESSLIEIELGITGDDGTELIEEIQKIYGVLFSHEDFGLSENEQIFHSEGYILGGLLSIFLGRDKEYVKALTVGQLHQSLLIALERTKA